MYCSVCCRVFEETSLEGALAAVSEHEAKKSCRKPVYDAHKGRFLKDEEIAEGATA